MKKKQMKIFFIIMAVALVTAMIVPSILYGQTGKGDNLSTYPKTSTGFVWYVYNKILDRDPAQSEVDIWVQRFNAKSASGFTLVMDAILGKEIGTTTKAMTDDNYLKFLYMSIFQRSPDMIGWNYWETLMSKGWSKEDVLEGFGRSKEFMMLAENFGVTPFFTREVNDEAKPAATTTTTTAATTTTTAATTTTTAATTTSS